MDIQDQPEQPEQPEQPIIKKKPGPKKPTFEGGCYRNPAAKSYRPNLGQGKGTIKSKQYKNKIYQRITLVEYNELIDYKNKYLELMDHFYNLSHQQIPEFS